MTRIKPTHGGKRPNAGRKPGSGTGRKTQAKSITLPITLWHEIESKRGTQSRSRYIRERLRLD